MSQGKNTTQEHQRKTVTKPLVNTDLDFVLYNVYSIIM